MRGHIETVASLGLVSPVGTDGCQPYIFLKKSDNLFSHHLWNWLSFLAVISSPLPSSHVYPVFFLSSATKKNKFWVGCPPPEGVTWGSLMNNPLPLLTPLFCNETNHSYSLLRSTLHDDLFQVMVQRSTSQSLKLQFSGGGILINSSLLKSVEFFCKFTDVGLHLLVSVSCWKLWLSNAIHVTFGIPCSGLMQCSGHLFC